MNHGVAATVLIVEDNPANQQVAQLMLEHLGYAVNVAVSGDQAIEMVATNSYAAVLMDCQMPGMDGFEATRQIRLRHPDRRVPVIACTASAMDGERERCLQAGMDDFLAKPVLVSELGAMLTRWVEEC